MAIKNKDIAAIQQISISPNPNNGIFNLDVALKEPLEMTIEVKDAMGKQVKILMNKTILRTNENHFEFDITDIPNGLHFLHLTSNKGVLVRRFIKVK